MALNNPFPATYYQPYQQYTLPLPQMQQPSPVPQQTSAVSQPTPQTQNNNLTWVQGEAGAKSYLVAPNTTVQLWDSEAQTIYLKSADASGMPSMRILDYTFRDTPAPSIPHANAPTPTPDYVTHEELQEFRDEVRAMIKPPVKKGAKIEE